VLADPRSSGSVYGLIWYLTQYLAPKGKPYGWNYYEELAKLDPRYVASHGTIGELVNIGERPVGLQVMQIVEKKDTSELWDASDNLDEACENCHVNYWYPHEGELFKKLDRRLVELYGRDNKPGQPARPSGR